MLFTSNNVIRNTQYYPTFNILYCKSNIKVYESISQNESITRYVRPGNVAMNKWSRAPVILILNFINRHIWQSFYQAREVNSSTHNTLKRSKRRIMGISRDMKTFISYLILERRHNGMNRTKYSIIVKSNLC